METRKEFPTADVLSTITGRLMGDIGGVYKVLSWMTDGPVWTHQLPRIGREAMPVLVNLHPALQKAVDEADQVRPDNWQEWREKWLDRYGPTISVPRFNADQHEPIDPLSELVEKVHPDRIVTIAPLPQGDEQ